MHTASSNLLRALIISSFLLLLSFPGKAQNFPTLHYTMEDGLPSNTVYDIYRDSKGMLWFATNKGAARYNGIKFEVFTTFNGLPDNEIFFFQEDYNGRIWLATFSGELCYFKDDSFHTAKNSPFLRRQLKSSFVKQISVEKDSSVTILFYEGESFATINDNKCKIIYINKNYNGARVNYDLKYVKKLSKTLYKLTCWDKVIYVNENGRIMTIANDKSEQYLNYQFAQNKSFLINKDAVYTMEGRQVKSLTGDTLLAKLAANPNSIHRVYFSDSNSFIATDNGLIVNDTMHLFKGQDIASVTQDNLGNYWISTLKNGVYKFNKAFEKQRVFNNAYTEKINFVFATDGNLFFTTASNSLYKMENGVPRCMFDYTKYKPRFDRFFETGYMVDTAMRYYSLCNEDHVILDNLLSERPQITRYACNFATPGIKNVFLSDKALYIQDIKTIGRIDFLRSGITGAQSEAYHPLVDAYAPLRIFSSAQAQDGAIWYSTINNVFRFKEGKTKPQKEFKNLSFRAFGFCGNYLVGYTHSNKLIIANTRESNIVKEVRDQNCIWDRIYKLDANHLLISTNSMHRIVSLYPSADTPRFSIQVVEDKFIPIYCDAICSDGKTCYFFKGGSIVAVDMKGLLTRPDPPALYFSTLKTGKASYPMSDGMQVSFFNSRSISISYAGVSFSGKDIAYQYSLTKDGRDNWRNIAGDINLLNPDYGEYTLKLRGKTISSDYSEPIALKFEISRPFWATWWFILIATAAFIFFIRWVVNKLIDRSLNKKEKEHQRMVKFLKSEYKALNALMNPHFIFNTLNNVQSLFNNNDKPAANEYMRVFSDLIRQNMHNVSRELISLQKEMDLVTNYLRLEKLRFEDKLNYTINIDKQVDLSEIMVPPLLIQPLVENSIKHGILPLIGRTGQINIYIYETGNQLFIEVRDNGVGLSAAMDNEDTLHESFGLENIKKRIEQLSIIQNKKITLDMAEQQDGLISWTIVTISMAL